MRRTLIAAAVSAAMLFPVFGAAKTLMERVRAIS